MAETRNRNRVLVNLLESDHLAEQEGHRTVILKWIFGKQVVRMKVW
jgi:hypothetical protein